MATHTTDPPGEPALARRRILRRRPVAGDVGILGRRLRRELELNTQPGERVRLCVRGALGHALVLLDDRMLILKRGLSAGMPFGAAIATISYRDVTGTQIGRRLLSGWIEIHSPSFQGGDRTRTLRQPGRHDPFRQPNCLPMRRRHAAAYHDALSEIGRLVAEARLDPERLPVLDQLERLAMLRRRGDLDAQEFELAKARILRDVAARSGRTATGS